jgi:hypothetical protein
VESSDESNDLRHDSRCHFLMRSGSFSQRAYGAVLLVFGLMAMMAVVRKIYGHGIFGGTTIRCQSTVTLRLSFRQCLQVGKL